jgi:hypothetical protein
LTNFNKVTEFLLLAVLIVSSTATAAAQGFTVPTGRVNNRLDWHETFEGSTGSSGQDMELNSSVTYNFRRFSVGVGIPVYLDRTISSTGAQISDGIGDFYVTVGSVWNGTLLNYSTILTGSLPTGDSNKGFSTKHATFDWSNRLDHNFVFLTPFLDTGIANSISDTKFFHRPFTSYGYLAHGEAGVDVDLPLSLTLTLSAYDIAPWGTQTIISRDVLNGAIGSGGQDGRVFEVNHITTGPASINYDQGLTAGITFNPKPYLGLDLGYTRSLSFEFNTFSWGIDINVSRLIGGNKLTK